MFFFLFLFLLRRKWLNFASAGNQTRVNCLEGSYAYHYTTGSSFFFIYFVCAMLPVFKASAYVFFRESTTCTSRRTCSVTRTSWAWSPLRRSWSPSPPSSTPRTPRGWSRSGSYRSYVFIFTNVGGFPLPPPNLVSL